MFLGLSENLKNEERNFTIILSSMLHPCGHFLGAEGRFLQNWETGKTHKMQKTLPICLFSMSETGFLR